MGSGVQKKAKVCDLERTPCLRWTRRAGGRVGFSCVCSAAQTVEHQSQASQGQLTEEETVRCNGNFTLIYFLFLPRMTGNTHLMGWRLLHDTSHVERLMCSYRQGIGIFARETKQNDSFILKVSPPQAVTTRLALCQNVIR